MTDPLEQGCPRCGASRQPDQEYCLECGLKLPPTSGALARARRGWVRRLGWYPGDWVWTTLLALVVAAAGAAVAIVATDDARPARNTGTFYSGTSPSVPLTSPSPAPATSVDTSTLPTPPEPTTTSKAKPTPKPPANGRTPWPAGQSGWTVVLESLPATKAGRRTAQTRADRAARNGLPDVGVLVSSRYSTLHPGYFVIFSGVYDSRADAESTLRAAASAGFSAAYVRQIAQ
jgi:hypothetical protein